MNKFRYAFLCAIFATGMAFAKPTTTLVYSDHEPLGNMRTRFIQQEFLQAIEQETEGRLKIKSHWGAEIAKGYDVLAAINDKKADIAVVVPEYDAKHLPLHQLFKSFPIGPTAHRQVQFFRSVYAELPEFKQELAQHNVVPIFLATGYPVAFFSAEPLSDLKNISGQKWRTASFWHKDFITNANAIPVTMPWNDGINQAIAEHKLDGLVVNVDSGYDLKADEFAPHITLAKELWLGHLYIIAMNKDIWEKLPNQDKQAIERAAERAYAKLGDVMNRSFDEQITKLRQRHADIRMLSTQEIAYWQQVTQYQRVQNTWVAKQKQELGIDMQPTLEKLRLLIEKYQ